MDARRWVSAGNKKSGLRYREHPERTVGVGRSKRPLRYYQAYFKYEGKFIADAFGWEDEFQGGSHEIEKIALELKVNRKLKVRPFTFGEMIKGNEKELVLAKEAEEEEERKKQLLEKTVFSKVIVLYLASKPDVESFKNMKGFYELWLEDSIGSKRLDEITLMDLEQVRLRMEAVGRAPRTIKTIKEVVRQVYNFAIDHEWYTGTVPYTKFLKKQVLNNQREAYYTSDQANLLLDALKKRSDQVYCLALLSLNTGMRFGEIASLLWQHIDMPRRRIIIVDPKNNSNRTIPMTDDVLRMFGGLSKGASDQLVFPDVNGQQMEKISNTFPRVVKGLKFNEGVTDRRLKLGFHSLRHTAASWMANQGVEMQVIAKILGHKTLAMTMRYSHINDKSVVDALSLLGNMER